MSNIETFGEFCKNNSCSNCRLKKIATITGCYDCEKHFIKEHDKQIRADMLNEFTKYLANNSELGNLAYLYKASYLLEQLKEQKNEYRCSN